MLGVSISFYKQELKRVPVHLNTKPMHSFDIKNIVTKEAIVEAQDYNYDLVGPSKELERFVHRIPLRFYKEKDFDKLCKIRASSSFMMDQSVEELFDKNISYQLIKKITSSIWRWGHKKEKWNDIVLAYNCIRAFTFSHPDFTVRLDHTTGYNERGWSEYTRTFLDGVFSYVVYHKGEHVMTIGFSIAPDKKLLIQQVQLKKPKGNRWLFKLPKNYLEAVIGLFKEAFPKHKLFIIEGNSAVAKYANDYRSALARVEKSIADATKWNRDYLESYLEEQQIYTKKLAHIKKDKERLIEFYSNTGEFIKVGKKLSYNQVSFEQIRRRNSEEFI